MGWALKVLRKHFNSADRGFRAKTKAPFLSSPEMPQVMFRVKGKLAGDLHRIHKRERKIDCVDRRILLYTMG